MGGQERQFLRHNPSYVSDTRLMQKADTNKVAWVHVNEASDSWSQAVSEF